MKQVTGYILSIFILLSTVLPCTFFPNSEEEQETSQTSSSDGEDDCKNCSPFATCSCSHGFTVQVLSIPQPILVIAAPTYNEYPVRAEADYHSRPFQPPRVG